MHDVPRVSRETGPPSDRAGSTDALELAAARLKALTLDYGLQPEVESPLLTLLEHFAHAGVRAPTTVTSPELAVDVHIADALAALPLGPFREARTIADIGAGAGVPGLVLAAVLPEARVRSVESQQSKCAFIAALAAAMGLTNTHVVCARAEEWLDGIGANEVVTARALAPQAVVLEYAAPLLKLRGHLIDWRGARRVEEEDAALRAAGELGLQRVAVRRAQPFEAAAERHLHVFEKVAETPGRFPRRVGVAKRKPLGGR